MIGILLVGVSYPTLTIASANEVHQREPDAKTAIGPDVRVLRIDGTIVEGQWVRITSGQSLVLNTASGPTSLPLEELQRVSFQSDNLKSKAGRAEKIDSQSDRIAQTPEAHRLKTDSAARDTAATTESPQNATPPSTDRLEDQTTPDTTEKTMRVVLDLADGGHLDGELADAKGETIVIDSVLGSGVAIKLDLLAGVQFSNDPKFQAARRAYFEALSRRRPAEDVLITLDKEEPRVLPGRIERLASLPDDAGYIIDFLFGGRSRTVRFDRLFGMVFAAGVGDRPAFPATFELRDGPVISGRITESDSESLTASTSLNTSVRWSLDRLHSIRLRSDRVVYVSDLPISSERTEGLLHRPWPVRRDRNVMGGPLSMAGRTFDKGIGCHSLTELRYKLDGRYEAFAATIGIDDHVRPGGAVVFRLLGDGKVLWDSGSVTGRDEPQDIVVNIKGINELTLLVDYGEGLDLSDHANWGAARLIRPAKSPTGLQ